LITSFVASGEVLPVVRLALFNLSLQSCCQMDAADYTSTGLPRVRLGICSFVDWLDLMSSVQTLPSDPLPFQVIPTHPASDVKHICVSDDLLDQVRSWIFHMVCNHFMLLCAFTHWGSIQAGLSRSNWRVRLIQNMQFMTIQQQCMYLNCSPRSSSPQCYSTPTGPCSPFPPSDSQQMCCWQMGRRHHLGTQMCGRCFCGHHNRDQERGSPYSCQCTNLLLSLRMH